MSERVAVAHYCEGAGHATRMLAVAEGIATAGYETTLAGGGPGKAFVERNGYSEFEPLGVDFIRGYQRGNLLVVLKECMPNIFGRVREYVSWLREEEPVLLVTDDLSAAIAATIDSMPYYYVTHDPAAFYTTTVERTAAWARNRFALQTAESFLLPKVWSGVPTIPSAVEIPPIAPASEELDESVDVLVVPSAFTVDQNRLTSVLERKGRDITLVGGEHWEIQESLQPYIAAANVVICSGYSTVMEAAVAGTPCILFPETSEQRGVAEAISSERGFYPVETVAEVERLLDRIEEPKPHENGTRNVVDAALDGLSALR